MSSACSRSPLMPVAVAPRSLLVESQTTRYTRRPFQPCDVLYSEHFGFRILRKRGCGGVCKLSATAAEPAGHAPAAASGRTGLCEITWLDGASTFWFERSFLLQAHECCPRFCDTEQDVR